MLRKLRSRITYANVVWTLCLFVVLGGGAYAATSFVDAKGQIHGCVGKDNQLAVRKPNGHCKTGQSQIAWNLRGRPGVRGLQGLQGIRGLQGVPGPGAMSFQNQFAVDGVRHLVTKVNGVFVYAQCAKDPGGYVALILVSDANHSLFAFGAKAQDDKLTRIENPGSSGFSKAQGVSTAELDGVAGALASGETVQWTRVDLSGIRGNACNFHGLIVPGIPSL